MSVLHSLFTLNAGLVKSVGGRVAGFARLILGAADIRGSILLGLFALAILWVGAWSMAREDASRTETAAFHETANLARVFEENIIRLIQAHDQILLSARSSLAKDPESFDLAAWAREQKFATEVSLQIVIINKDGMLAGTTLGMPPAPMDLSDREHFRVHVDATGDELFISKPLLGRVSKKWSLQLSRRVAGADGSFGGVILVSIDPDYLANFYESIDIRKNGMVLLAGLDGIVRVRVSSGDRTIGQSIASGALFQMLATASSGSYITSGNVDNAARYTSYRRVKGYPLVVAVGLARAEIMAGVNRHRLVYYGVAAFVSVLALVFMATIVRRQIKLQRARDELWAAANIDALTGLPNRNHLHDIVAAMMGGARTEQGRFAVFLIDVDNFKMINDTLGHEAGDLVLRTAARRLRRMSRKAHVVARLGGDEFAILLPGVGGQREIEDLAQRVMGAVRRKMKYRGHSIEMSISIGIACLPDHANTWTGIFRAADLALYRAKQAGRNRSVFFEPPMLAEVETRFAVVESARSAIRNDRVMPFYQPEIDIETGEVVGFEALARIRQDDDRICVPAEFASALEDPEVGPAFGLKMLERVIADLKCWTEAGLGVRRIAVNASNVELRSGNYAERIVALLAANGVDPHRLEIEVTETAAFDDSLGVINHNLNTLAAHGVSIALDDFGTGFASLTHLKSLPVTKVKIDRSFVCNIVTDVGSASIIDAIVRLSHGLGKSVVAEGVEDEEQLARLRALDCDVAQGFLFSRPVPFDGVAAFLLRRSAQTPAAGGTPAERTSGRRANQRLRLVHDLQASDNRA